MRNSQKRFAPIVILIITIAVLAIGGGTYIYLNKQSEAPAANRSIRTQIISPTGGEAFQVGQTVKIQWKVDPKYKTISVALVPDAPDKCTAYTNNGSMGTCKIYEINHVANTGSYDWIIGSEKDINSKPAHPGDYVIRLQPDQEENRVGYSGYFKIAASQNTISSDQQKVLATAREVIKALAARDYQKLKELTSPNGLSLDIYPRFDLTKNLIAQSEISLIPADTKIYLWGYTDGKGDPINLTRMEFLTKWIYTNSIDYLKAPDVAVNKKLGGGNSLNTIDEDTNGRTYAAFHFSGFDPKYSGMDWTTLYLIFDSTNGEYKLRGVAKDNWTI